MVSVERRSILSSVSKSDNSSTLFMPKHGENAGISKEPQKLKSNRKRNWKGEENPMRTNADLTNLYILIEAATQLSENRDTRGKKAMGNVVTESHIPTGSFYNSEGKWRKKKGPVNPLGCNFLGESRSHLSGSHSQYQKVLRESLGDSRTHTSTLPGLQYFGKKQQEKSNPNDIELSKQPVQLKKHSSAKNLKSYTVGAHSMVRRITADFVTKGKITLGYLGITFYKRIGRWSAHIWAGKQFYVGSYPTATEAARAYDKAGLKYFDSAAQLNYRRIDYGSDIKEMATLTSKEYRRLLTQRAKRSKHVYVEEGVAKCPEGWFEVKVKEKVPHTKWRFLGRFENLEDARRCYQKRKATQPACEQS